MRRMRPLLALLVVTASLWGGAAAGGGVEITVHSEPLYAGASRALPLGFHTLVRHTRARRRVPVNEADDDSRSPQETDGAVASARVPSGLRATFYELASGDGAHVLIEAGQSVPDFSSSGFSRSPCAVLVELEGASEARPPPSAPAFTRPLGDAQRAPFCSRTMGIDGSTSPLACMTSASTPCLPPARNPCVFRRSSL